MRLLLWIVLPFSFLLWQAAPAGAALSNKTTLSFTNDACATTNSCDLKKFEIELNAFSEATSGSLTKGVYMTASYETQDVAHLRDYVIVQFVRGCGYGSSLKNKTPLKYRNVHRDYFGLNQDYVFHHPNWSVDSFDLDPSYGSDVIGRHALYFNVRPNLPFNNTQFWRRDYFQLQSPTVPRVYTYDSPTASHAFIGGPKSQWNATNMSLAFKTCMFKSQDVPVRIDPTWNGENKALHCFDWTSSNVFDFGTGELKTTTQIDPYCLAPRDSQEEKTNDEDVALNVQKPLPVNFQLEGSLIPPAWQPQLSVDHMQTSALPPAEVQAALSRTLFIPVKGFEYRPLFRQVEGLVKKVNLNFLVEAGTRWDGEGIMAEQIRRAAEIFSQCGVELESTRVYTAKFKSEAQKMLLPPTDPYVAPPNAAMLPFIHIPRPLGILFGSENPDAIYAVNQASIDASPARASMLNTVWLNQIAVQHLGPVAWKQGYVALAHEVAHVLGNFYHTYFRDPNLMSYSFEGIQGKSGDLTPGQCEAIRTFGIVK